MSKFFNPDAPFMQGLGKVADLILLNILTVLLSIPIVTAGAAVTALYDAIWRILRDEGSIYKTSSWPSRTTSSRPRSSG